MDSAHRRRDRHEFCFEMGAGRRRAASWSSRVCQGDRLARGCFEIVPIPALLESGLLPAGIHLATIDDVQAAFGSSSDRRTELFGGLTKFVQVARKFRLFKTLLIDGSFVTDKAAPGDIDAVLEMDRGSLAILVAHPNREEVLNHDFVKAFYSIDLYLSAIDPPIVAFFQHVRTSEAIVRKLGPDALKGIVRITL